jgi:serine/threonine protein kinase
VPGEQVLLPKTQPGIARLMRSRAVKEVVMELSPELQIAPVSERYAIEAYLGRGSRSLVFKAFDRRNGVMVALKSLVFAQGEDIVRFKREFRELGKLSHRNIVALYDLHIDPPQCYFTMEYVEGKDFSSAVRSNSDLGSRIDYDALNANATAVVSALQTVHAHGRVHLDVKPSNVLVSSAHRVVVLDFGLAALATPPGRTTPTGRAGTLAYMCPEQAAGAPPAPEFDWYALGVMLFETVTGGLPHEAVRAPTVMARAPECPSYMSELIERLADADPARRPDGVTILRMLRAQKARGARRAELPMATGAFSPVGREDGLERLNEGLSRTLAGDPQLVVLAGESGVGKSSLVEHFSATLARDAGVALLCSRCHYQETIRYPALDGIVDGLADLLAQGVAFEPSVSAFEFTALRRLFPVLESVRYRVEGQLDGEPLDPFVMTERALGALCRLLAELSMSRPLLLWIDDFQWGDASSEPFLRRILATPTSRILVIVTHRPDDHAASIEQLGALRASGEVPDQRISQVLLNPLGVEDSAALFAHLSGMVLATEEERTSLTQGTGGLPIFIREIARHGWGNDMEVRRFDPAIALSQRLHALPPTSHEILALVALCDLPIDEAALLGVEGMRHDAHGAVARLCRDNFLKKVHDKDGVKIAMFHDRLRHAVAGLLPPARKRVLHARIAEVLARSPQADPRALVAHYVGAEQTAMVGQHAVLAARREAERLNFSIAADFLALAIQYDHGAGSLSDLNAEYGGLLANAGMSRKAAQAYLRSIETLDHARSSRLQAAQLKVRAAEQFLYAGLLTTGVDLLRNVFADLALPYPHNRRSALRTALMNRIRFALRVWRTGASPTLDVPAETLLRLDTLWVAAKGTCMLDYVVGDAMASWYLRESIEAREPVRLMRAFGLEASISANVGGRVMLNRSNAMMSRLRELISFARAPADRAFVHQADATIAWFKGEWRRSAALADQAIEIYRSSCHGVQFDVAIILGWGLTARAFMGEIDAVRRLMPELLTDARKRGDEYFFDVFRSSFLGYLIAAADDRCDAALNVIDGTLRNVPNDRFTSLHFHHLIAATNCLLYLGDGQRAWDLVNGKWPEVAATGFLRLTALGSFLRELRARAAIAAACAHGVEPARRRTLLAIASRDARAIHKACLPFASAMASAIDSMLAGLEGQRHRQKALLDVAIAGYRAADMRLYAEALAQRQLTHLEHQAPGGFMATEQIQAPLAFAAMFYPAPAPSAA